VKGTIPDQLTARQREIEDRLDRTRLGDCSRPVLDADNIRYEISERVHAIPHGGIGAFHLLARRIGLVDAIDRGLHLLQIHLPYHESDHVLNLAYNALCNGDCLQDIELRRNDVNFLDALGARRIPDPTTAGDFCRRFAEGDINALQDIYDDVRVGVWRRQPPGFFAEAVLDADGTLVATAAEHKEGVDIAYDGTWGYHPLVVSLANTGEVLSLVNRSGNRPSHEGAAREVNRSLVLCLEAGFRRVLLRGDTDFSQTEHLDGWDALGPVRFIFGYNAMLNLQGIADDLPVSAWRTLERPARYEVKTRPRQRPENVKDRVVRDRQYETLRLQGEDVAEFDYQPTACRQSYRMVVVRKNITKEKGGTALFDQVRYFFYITNEREWPAEEVVFSANDRCNQENLIAQLKSGVRSLQAPVDTLVSNWAYMVMAALAWNLKAWFALALPEVPGRWQERHRQEKRWVLGLEFRTFLSTFMLLPCQIVRTGRKVVYRLLSWGPRLDILFRLIAKLRC
jgi:hypothetical protein